MFIKEYFGTIYNSIKSLLTGMKLTGYYFTHLDKIVTEEYPDNRSTLKMADRFRGEVIMPHDEKNEHQCTGCQSCELSCPNGSIKIITKQILTTEGKKKKAIDTWVYHLDMCTMCGMCVEACPTTAILMGNEFEHSQYEKKYLKKVLNKPGSKVKEGVE
ncbi:MAG: 4Fe-4S binding protein [Bacteroidetes bacterium]|nr:4Fe-4S binding protein [Bacteroidota bacterium]